MTPPEPRLPAASADAPPELPSAIDSLVNRPPSQRLQEFKYRFGQAAVFGLPVLALQWFGRSLGGAESERWVAILQALLAGWVLYVVASGMVAEGALLVLHRRLTGDLLADALVGLVASGFYVAGLARLANLLAGRPTRFLATFHWTVALLALWCGLRWAAKKARRDRPAERRDSNC